MKSTLTQELERASLFSSSAKEKKKKNYSTGNLIKDANVSTCLLVCVVLFAFHLIALIWEIKKEICLYGQIFFVFDENRLCTEKLQFVKMFRSFQMT